MKKYNFKLELHPEIKFDLQEGVDYYRAKSPGLGNRFYRVAKGQIRSLKKDAFFYQVKYDDTRCLKVPSFPYLIHYRIDEVNNTVFIDAVIHTSRSPKRWGKRK